MLEVAGEGGGGEPAEVVGDGHGAGSMVEAHGPGVGVPSGWVGVLVGIDELDGEAGRSRTVAAGFVGGPAGGRAVEGGPAGSVGGGHGIGAAGGGADGHDGPVVGRWLGR